MVMWVGGGGTTFFDKRRDYSRAVYLTSSPSDLPSGVIPEQLGNLDKLTKLFLGGNKFQGGVEGIWLKT